MHKLYKKSWIEPLLRSIFGTSFLRKCLNECAHGVSNNKIDDALHRYFNFVSHKVGYYMAGNKYLVYRHGEEFSNCLGVSDDLEYDLKEIHRIFGVQITYGSPRLFVYGIFNKMNIYEESFLDRADVCAEIFQKARKAILPDGYNLFRIRNNLTSLNSHEFDSNPDFSAKKGRFDLGNMPVFYCSDDVATCIYEARMLAGDDATLATYRIIKELTIVDLTTISDHDNGPHESIRVILYALTNSRYSHKNLQILSNAAHEGGFHGIKYRSFYSQICEHDTSSYVIFGSPMKDGAMTLHSLNQVNIRKIDIEYDLGFSSERFLLSQKQCK